MPVMAKSLMQGNSVYYRNVEALNLQNSCLNIFYHLLVVPQIYIEFHNKATMTSVQLQMIFLLAHCNIVIICSKTVF